MQNVIDLGKNIILLIPNYKQNIEIFKKYEVLG